MSGTAMTVAVMLIVLALAAALGYLFLPRRRSAEERARLVRAAGEIDRELAANIELVSMYWQTKRPAVFEMSGYRTSRDVILGADPQLGASLDALYASIPQAESAMERRGPAGSIRDDDRLVVEGWEGEARWLQRSLRALPANAPPTPAARLLGRLSSKNSPEGRAG